MSASEISTDDARRIYGSSSDYTVFQANYGKAQNLLDGIDATYFHSSGKMGWCYDIFELGNVVICTGYRGMFGRECGYLPKYEQMAKEAKQDYSLSWEERQEKLKEVRQEFVKAVGGEYFED